MPVAGGRTGMGHTVEDKTRLLQRVWRLRGQVEGIERARGARHLVEVVHAYLR
jgi:DNA-binding FrmR family transcriptional regulator